MMLDCIGSLEMLQVLQANVGELSLLHGWLDFTTKRQPNTFA